MTIAAYEERAVVQRRIFKEGDKKLLREWTTAHCHLNTGPRGAGKSELMAGSQGMSLIVCEWINNLYKDIIGSERLPHPLKVYSNMPVSISYQASQDGALWHGAQIPKVLSTLPLDMHKVITFHPDMKYCFVYYDEIDQAADRQDWQNGGQKLFMRVLVQARKLHIKLTGTIQSIQWVNPRLMFQVDTTTACRDASKTSWGMVNNLEPGELVFTYTRDISGGITGQTYEESGMVYEGQFYGLPIQQIYDTDYIQNPWDRYESVTVARKKVTLIPPDAKEIGSYDDDTAILEDTLRELRERQVETISRPDFFKICQAKGLVMSKKEASDYIVDVHNVRRYLSAGEWKYDLKEIKNLQSVAVLKKKKQGKTVKRDMEDEDE